MRSFLTLACLLMLATTSAFAGGRRRVAAASPAEELSITFVGMSNTGDALFDAGVASRPRGVIVRTFGLRIDSIARTAGTAVVRAWLEANDGRSAIRIDGHPLGAQPRLIDAHAPLGHVTTHRLEIEVPPDVDPGAFASSIRFEAETP